MGQKGVVSLKTNLRGFIASSSLLGTSEFRFSVKTVTFRGAGNFMAGDVSRGL